MIDISINITLHSEGLLFYKTFRSISAQLGYLDSISKKSISYEINISADNPSQETSSVVEYILKKYNYKIKLYKLSTGDISYNRNFLVDKSSGKYIAFFDGDDLFSENYLYNCFVAAESSGKPAVYTAENFITFEGENILWKKPDSSSRYYSPAMMLQENPFPSQVFAKKAIFNEIKYRELGERGGPYGSEDWHWMTMIADAGYKMVSVKDTLYAYRVKLNGSLLKEHQSTGTTIMPSTFFESKHFINNCSSTISRIKPNSAESNDSTNIKNIDTNRSLRGLYDAKVPLTIRKFIASTILANKNLARGISNIIKNKLPKVTGNTKDADDGRYNDFKVKPKEEFRIKFGNLFSSKSIDILWNQICQLNKFEPLINNDLATIRQMQEYDLFKNGNFRVSYEYYKLCKFIEDNNIKFEHIVFVPWLVPGGSDNVAIKVANSLSEDGEVLMVMTDKFDKNYKYGELSSRVRIYNFESIFNDNARCDDYIDRLFLRLIQNSKIKTVSSINSLYANNLIRKYGRQIKDHSRIFVYRWSVPKNYYDNYYEWPANFYYNTHSSLDFIVTDNRAIIKDINSIMNPFESRIKVLDMPAPRHINFKGAHEMTKRVLIAGRIAKWDKLVEETLIIASDAKLKDINFDFWGTLDEYYEYANRFQKLISKYENIKFKGEYKGFGSIDISKYDISLFVSRSEGMPNVVLESVGANLFVVAPNVGGVSEVIKDGVNGYLISDPLDMRQYVNAVLRFYNSRTGDSFKKQTEFNQKIIGERTEDNFRECVKEVYSV